MEEKSFKKQVIKNITFPKLYLKTPMIEESISLKNGVFLADTRIEVCVYQKADKNYCSVITKDLNFKNGYSETILLKYIDNVQSYDDVLDLTDDFMDEYNS